MKFISCCTCALALVIPRAMTAPTALPTRPHDRGALRIMTYNILGGRNTDGKRDLTRVADVIKALNPDFVSLQEVDVKTSRIKGVDVPAELAKLTGLHAAFAEAMPFAGGSYGVAVLSRWKASKQTNHALPHGPKDEPRVALELHCQSPASQKPIVFIATHLEASSEATRSTQIEFLLKELKPTLLAGPALLAGDLNATADSKELKQLFTFWQSTWPADKPGFTWPTDNPRSRIDHLLLQPKAGWTVDKTFRGDEAFPDDHDWIVLLTKASDHLPVVLEVSLAAK